MLDTVDDIHVLTGALKLFFRELKVKHSNHVVPEIFLSLGIITLKDILKEWKLTN